MKAAVDDASTAAPLPCAAAEIALTVVITCVATFSNARALSASTPAAYGLNSVSDMPSSPKALATSASVKDDCSRSVEAGDRTDAPLGPVIVTPLSNAPEEPSIALICKPPAVAELVVTTTFASSCVEDKEKPPSASVYTYGSDVRSKVPDPS